MALVAGAARARSRAATAAHRRAGPGAPGDAGRRRPPEEWDVARVPTTCGSPSASRPRGRVVARGKDLDALREAARRELRRQARAGASLERTGLRTWELGAVPEEVAHGGRAPGPGLPGARRRGDLGVAAGAADPRPRRAEHRRGVRRLLLLNVTAPWKRVLARLTNAQKLALADNPHGSVPALLQDCLDGAVDAIVAERCRARCARRRRTPRRSPPCAPIPRPGWCGRRPVEPVLAEGPRGGPALDADAAPTRRDPRRRARPAATASCGRGSSPTRGGPAARRAAVPAGRAAPAGARPGDRPGTRGRPTTSPGGGRLRDLLESLRPARRAPPT